MDPEYARYTDAYLARSRAALDALAADPAACDLLGAMAEADRRGDGARAASYWSPAMAAAPAIPSISRASSSPG